MYGFSEATLSALKTAGWHPRRRVNTSRYREWFAQNGFFYGDNADAFLAIFGGLDISTTARLPGVTSIMNVQPVDGAKSTFLENVTSTSEELSKLLTVIGYLDGAEMILLMADDRTVYADFSGELYLVAATGGEAIEAFVTGKKFVRLNPAGSVISG